MTKKSFTLYNDSLFILEEMTDEEAGKLFKAIAAYQYGKEIELDRTLKLIFVSFKNQFDRDGIEYLKTCETNRNNALGKNKSQPLGASRSQSQPVAAHTDTDKDTDKDTKKEIFSFDSFWATYKKSADKKKCEAKWSKLSNTDKEKIKLSLPAYIASTPDVKFRKNPLTYLNGQCWNDEIIEHKIDTNSNIRYATGTIGANGQTNVNFSDLLPPN